MSGDLTKHNPAGTARGYRLEDFADAFGPLYPLRTRQNRTSTMISLLTLVTLRTVRRKTAI